MNQSYRKGKGNDRGQGDGDETPCSVSIQGKPQPTKQTTDPIERSIPPVMMTKATPILMIPKRAVRRRRFSRLYESKRRSLRIEVATKTKTRRDKIPSIFFIGLKVQAACSSADAGRQTHNGFLGKLFARKLTGHSTFVHHEPRSAIPRTSSISLET